MPRCVGGQDRKQRAPFPERLDDWIHEDSTVRVIDVFGAELDLNTLGFDRADPAVRGGRRTARRRCSRSTAGGCAPQGQDHQGQATDPGTQRHRRTDEGVRRRTGLPDRSRREVDGHQRSGHGHRWPIAAATKASESRSANVRASPRWCPSPSRRTTQLKACSTSATSSTTTRQSSIGARLEALPSTGSLQKKPARSCTRTGRRTARGAR